MQKPLSLQGLSLPFLVALLALSANIAFFSPAFAPRYGTDLIQEGDDNPLSRETA